ncbi:hypothetical protein ElyMa_006385500 [Elysia marginata]|uniref:Mannan-binding protein domain-containing protein n=1 Tax=Elysia marginata TaxID=1093978 RepID=A0AAV4HT20_9GAST|nr:hypothetical protein ElyMa_006385500 [Elysia marginata]
MPLPSIRTSRGVTLVEMSFVLLIIVVIVAMAFYSYKVYSGNPKHMEAALLAHEIKQDINLRHQTKRELPDPYVLSHVSQKTVSGAEVIRDGSSGVRVNVYLQGDSGNRGASSQVYTLYGNLVNDELAWVDCGKDCVKNAVDIPPAAAVPPAAGGNNKRGNGDTGTGGDGTGTGPGGAVIDPPTGIRIAVAPPEPPKPPAPPAKPEKPKFKVFTSRNNDPIWNDAEDAQVKCPQRCANEGGQWTGHWWTTEWNEHSVCQCKKAI